MSNIFKTIKPFVVKHEPEILVGIGLSGMLFTTYYTAKATAKAVKIIQENEADGKVLTNKEKFKLVWKLYLPVLGGIVGSSACIIGGNRVQNKRAAALAAAYTMSETALQEYRDKTLEIAGAQKEQKIHESISADGVSNAIGKSEVVITGDGDSLFYEPLSGRFFKTNWNKILKAANELNSNALSGFDGTITLTDWFDKLGLSKTNISDTIGWNTNKGQKGLIDISIDSTITPDDVPCGSIYYNNRPALLE